MKIDIVGIFNYILKIESVLRSLFEIQKKSRKQRYNFFSRYNIFGFLRCLCYNLNF